MSHRLARSLRPHAWPAAAGLVLGLLALGPALGRGFVLSYDMVFVPDPPIGSADLGLGGGPPRAVPSDLVVALAARIIGAQFVQKIILLGIFVLACSGAAALLSCRSDQADEQRPALLARLAAGVCYAWNPFVAERLIMGQWAMLLGYAGLPWVARELCRSDHRVRIGRLAAALIPAAVGGFAAMSITLLAAVPVAVCGPRPWRVAARRLGLVLAVILAFSLVWLIPSFTVPVHADPRGVGAFAARSDTPFGAVVSLLMLGGIWNAQAVPAGYGGPASAGWLVVALLAVAGYLLVARRQRLCPGVAVAAVAGLAIAAIGLSAPTRAALAAAITFWPGFAVLRDGQQFLAPLALAEAIGLGAGVSWLFTAAGKALAADRPAARATTSAGAVASQPTDSTASRPADPDGSRPARRTASPGDSAGPAAVLGVLALLAPVLLLPGLAWGAAGRLRAAQYPADWLSARQIIDHDPRAGSVLLLPWAQYRRYRWNDGEAVYDPWPRLVARAMIWNDALQVGSVTVAPESAQARRLGPIVTSGRPLTGALRAAGVRYVVIDAGPLLNQQGTRVARLARLLPGAQIVLASPESHLVPDTNGIGRLELNTRKALESFYLISTLAR